MIHNICPYPGLRPFTEEESIFFKGRDTHIKQIITQLQDKKIVIVTGNSGAGKSSLIFAGVVPNARAGFFKALYNNWAVAVFRPERSPLKNLAEAVAGELGFETEKAYEELQYGFSALVDLYQKSKFYIDPDSEQWKNADEEERKRLKSSGANLLIIADQFEEFFTNPENFAGGKPSPEAYTTVNLLLETASIALRNNLPVYIIFTMRSDYISDCVAFKGLPEYIGYSQFFVPRLKRNELQQVIEEPAKLAGGSVSKRLTEVLINGLREGFDQLPILQHTLNLLWKKANNGQEELNLIHLARVAGLHRSYLDDKDKAEFDKWFKTLPENEKKYFENPSLSNVLNYHANTLYDNAYKYFLEKAHWADKDLTEQEAKHILKICFSGLTRIDEGRAVRNRMSLKEITNLIGNPKIDYAKVNGVINIYREPESTFIRPFIDPEDIKTQYIPSNTILDITHESLIRNWELLQKWEAEEEENLNDFMEFKVQLQRWLENDKSKAYLLPLGTLTYFEGWYERCKPNKYWIAKYDKSDKTKEEKLQYAEFIAKATVEFLEQSRANIIAIEKRKRRLRIFFAAFATLVILALSGFTLWALREKQNAEYQRSIAEKQKNQIIQANKKAEAEKLRAEKEKRRAEIAAQKAIAAQKKAEEAMKQAIAAQRLAEENSQKAKEEAYKALLAKRRADSLRQIALQQKQIAEIQKEKAEKAQNEALRLSILALTQSVAFKATQTYDDPQLNLLLAYYAYRLNNEYGGNPNDPVIYDGLRFAYFLATKYEPYKCKKSPIDFIVQNNQVLYYAKDGTVNRIIPQNKSEGTISFKKKYIVQSPIKGRFTSSNSIISIDFVGRLYYVDIAKKKSYLITKDDFSNATDITGDDNTVIVAKEKQIYVWNKNGEEFVLDKKIKLKENINRLQYKKEDQTLYAAVKTGTVYKINMQTYQTERLTQDLKKYRKLKKAGVSAFTISPQSTYMGLGFELGDILIFKLKDSMKVGKLTFINTYIQDVKFDTGEKKFVVLAPSNQLKVYDIRAINERPITISLKSSIAKIIFDNEMIYALDFNKQLWIVQTENKAYAENIEEKIKRDLSDKEWQEFFGPNVPRKRYFQNIKQQ